VRWDFRGTVHELYSVCESDVEQASDVIGIELAILVHRHDPLGAGRRHPGDRRRMLPEVSRQPYGADERDSRYEPPNHHVRPIGPSVVDKNDLGDAHRTPLGRPAILRQRNELADERVQGMLTLIDGHDNRDRVPGHGSLFDCGHGSQE